MTQPLQPNLLIVEEDPIQAHALSDYLKERGYHCSLATSPAGALALCQEEVYDLALVNSVYRHDWHGGARLIRSLYGLHLLPSVLISGAFDPQQEGTDILRKPYTGIQCLRMIRNRLDLEAAAL
jgi:DNA-binding response OmpR family regulator